MRGKKTNQFFSLSSRTDSTVEDTRTTQTRNENKARGETRGQQNKRERETWDARNQLVTEAEVARKYTDNTSGNKRGESGEARDQTRGPENKAKAGHGRQGIS